MDTLTQKYGSVVPCTRTALVSRTVDLSVVCKEMRAKTTIFNQQQCRSLAPICMKLCMMVHIGPGQKVSPFGVGRCPQRILGLNFGHLTANISKTVSRSVTCQLELNISSTKPFKAWSGSFLAAPPPVRPNMWQFCVFFHHRQL